MKLGILNFTTAADLSPGDAVIHYLIAACDPNDAISRLGDELIRKRWELVLRRVQDTLLSSVPCRI